MSFISKSDSIRFGKGNFLNHPVFLLARKELADVSNPTKHASGCSKASTTAFKLVQLMFFLSRISTCCEEEPKKYLLWYWIFCLCSCCFSFFWCCYTTQRSFCPAELGVLALIRLWKQKRTSLNVFAWTVKCIFAEENDSSSICKKKYVFFSLWILKYIF